MKRIFWILSFLFASQMAKSQDLTGIWTGTFYTSNFERIYGSPNRYEIQLDNVGRAAKGVTYSYQDVSFYGKATLVGMWSSSSKNLIFNEKVLLEYKFEGTEESVAMFTCYLQYRKEGSKEILEGDYTSKLYKSGKDAGSGKIYLEKTTKTPFKKEDFIIAKEKKDLAIKLNKSTTPPPAKTVPAKPKPAAPVLANKPKPTPPKPNTTLAAKPKTTTPKINSNPISNVPKKTTPPTPVGNPPIAKKTEPVAPPKQKPVAIKPADLPKVLKERDNELVQTIPVSSNEIEVNFYDNGEIDGDTISVFCNGKLLGEHKGLSTQAITYKIKIDENTPNVEIVMVAENLGSIPPNTALMIVKVGNKRYDVNLASTESKNAMVRFRYQKE